jgi:hypothetical protein
MVTWMNYFLLHLAQARTSCQCIHLLSIVLTWAPDRRPIEAHTAHPYPALTALTSKQLKLTC